MEKTFSTLLTIHFQLEFSTLHIQQNHEQQQPDKFHFKYHYNRGKQKHHSITIDSPCLTVTNSSLDKPYYFFAFSRSYLAWKKNYLPKGKVPQCTPTDFLLLISLCTITASFGSMCCGASKCLGS